MRRKWLLCGILCGVVSLSVFGQNVGASNYDKQIKETEKQQKEWENKADSLQKEIEEIQMGHPVLPASDESRIGARPLLIRGKRDLIVDKAALLFQIAQDFRSRHGFDWALCR